MVVDRLPLVGNGEHIHCFRALLWNSHSSLQGLFQDSREILEGSDFLFSGVFIRRHSFKFKHSNKQQAGRVGYKSSRYNKPRVFSISELLNSAQIHSVV